MPRIFAIPSSFGPRRPIVACLTCHLNQPTHVGRINSSHAKNQVSCVSCHSIHKNGPNGLVPRKATDINQLCSGCHIDVWASFQRPFTHKLPQGAMSCVDCHNPHGGVLQHGLQTANSNEPGCFKCHGDKRAGPSRLNMRPSGWKAALPAISLMDRPIRACWTRAEVRFVCLECHSNLPAPTLPANGTIGTVPPGIHDLVRQFPRFQNCNVCHQKVHGSYVSRDLLK